MIKLESVTKVYETDRIETLALDNINLEVDKGQCVKCDIKSKICAIKRNAVVSSYYDVSYIERLLIIPFQYPKSLADN